MQKDKEMISTGMHGSEWTSQRKLQASIIVHSILPLLYNFITISSLLMNIISSKFVDVWNEWVTTRYLDSKRSLHSYIHFVDLANHTQRFLIIICDSHVGQDRVATIILWWTISCTNTTTSKICQNGCQFLERENTNWDILIHGCERNINNLRCEMKLDPISIILHIVS